ncbi:protein kinase [Streptomyces sp. NPDC003300]|uniref:serine/threonine-protein kinase n=1 Tax=unclassified Streptomyces TaxID=2593676 RepID=UPI0033B18B3D
MAGYRLLARIGEGGMGSVYLSHTRGGQPVALKVIRREYAQDEEFRRRFQQEVQSARRVQGYHVVPVVDHDTTGNRPWLATSYIPGLPLDDALARYGALPVATALQLVGCAAEALRAVHAAGVIHRDLKPSNVLLGAGGPWVIDFGIARAADSTQLTRSGGLIGTPQYMSPEHANGHELTPATDLFSLGLIAAVAATGRHPYGTAGAITLATQIANTAVRPPDLSGYPDELRTVLERCLTADPAARPTPAELAELCERGAGRPLRDFSGWLPQPLAAEIARREAAAALPPAPAPPAAPAAPPHIPAPAVPPAVPPAMPQGAPRAAPPAGTGAAPSGPYAPGPYTPGPYASGPYTSGMFGPTNVDGPATGAHGATGHGDGSGRASGPESGPGDGQGRGPGNGHGRGPGNGNEGHDGNGNGHDGQSRVPSGRTQKVMAIGGSVLAVILAVTLTYAFTHSDGKGDDKGPQGKSPLGGGPGTSTSQSPAAAPTTGPASTAPTGSPGGSSADPGTLGGGQPQVIFQDRKFTIRSPAWNHGTHVDLDSARVEPNGQIGDTDGYEIEYQDWADGSMRFLTTFGRADGTDYQACRNGVGADALSGEIYRDDLAKDTYIAKGTVLCTVTSEGNLAMLKVTDVTPSGNMMTDPMPTYSTLLTVWKMPDAPTP